MAELTSSNLIKRALKNVDSPASQKFTVAIVAPVDEKVPPEKYGGTELFVYNLARCLAELRCRVVLLGSGDSMPPDGVELVACSKRATRLLPGSHDPEIRHQYWIDGAKCAAEYISEHHDEIDIVVNNNGWPFLEIIDKYHIKEPIVTVLHGTLVVASENAKYRQHQNRRYISISDSQREPLPDLNYLGTIHHGIDISKYRYRPKSEGYFAWLGRYNPDKGPLEAMHVASETQHFLKMAGKVDPVDQSYYDDAVAPKFGKGAENWGEIGLEEKNKLLGGAKALIFPLQWAEPFGLVMIEALACGTPVCALRKGSVPEIIEDGVTGLVCDTVEEMIHRINKGELKKINRATCRQAAEERFSDFRMTKDHLTIYKQVARLKTPK